MTCCRAVLCVLVAVGSTSGAIAQSNSTERASYAPIVLRLACGGLAQATCVKVAPRIAARTMQAGVELKPLGSGLALDTASAVCEGAATAAIVQRDALALVARLPSCSSRFDVVGKPLYPLYAFLVVKAGGPFRQLGDLAGKRLVVTGSAGSGGQIALGFLLRSDPTLQRSVRVSMADPAFALTEVANGSAEAFFALDTLDSDLIDRVRLRLDPRGKPLYSFIEIRPGQEFFRIGDAAGHCLYRLTALDFGAGVQVTTVSEDAVMLLARASRDVHAKGGPRAAEALAGAIDAAAAAILADTKSPSDWRGVGSLCQ